MWTETVKVTKGRDLCDKESKLYKGECNDRTCADHCRVNDTAWDGYCQKINGKIVCACRYDCKPGNPPPGKDKPKPPTMHKKWLKMSQKWLIHFVS